MSTGIQIAEAGWSVPATKGELMLVQSDLNGRIDQVAADLSGKIYQVDNKIDRVVADLDKKIDVGPKNVELGLSRMIWVAAGALTAVGILLRFEVLVIEPGSRARSRDDHENSGPGTTTKTNSISASTQAPEGDPAAPATLSCCPQQNRRLGAKLLWFTARYWQIFLAAGAERLSRW